MHVCIYIYALYIYDIVYCMCSIVLTHMCVYICVYIYIWEGTPANDDVLFVVWLMLRVFDVVCLMLQVFIVISMLRRLIVMFMLYV